MYAALASRVRSEPRSEARSPCRAARPADRGKRRARRAHRRTADRDAVLRRRIARGDCARRAALRRSLRTQCPGPRAAPQFVGRRAIGRSVRDAVWMAAGQKDTVDACAMIGGIERRVRIGMSNRGRRCFGSRCRSGPMRDAEQLKPLRASARPIRNATDSRSDTASHFRFAWREGEAEHDHRDALKSALCTLNAMGRVIRVGIEPASRTVAMRRFDAPARGPGSTHDRKRGTHDE